MTPGTNQAKQRTQGMRTLPPKVFVVNVWHLFQQHHDNLDTVRYILHSRRADLDGSDDHYLVCATQHSCDMACNS